MSDTTRIVIDTEDLRALARRLGGATDAVAEVRLALLRAHDQLDAPQVRELYTHVVDGLRRFGEVIATDQQALIHDILAVEADEGVEPAVRSAATATEDRGPFRVLDRPHLFIPALLGTARRPDPAEPPEPWDQAWVDEEGAVPADGARVPIGPTGPDGYSSSAEAGFEAEWSAGGSFGGAGVGGSGSASAGAKGWAEAEASAGRTEDGGYQASASAEAGVSVEASAEGELHLGGTTLEGSASAQASASAEASAGASIGPDGVSVEASASAEVSASAQAEVRLEDAYARAEAEAAARAHASAHASAGKDGVEVGFGAGASAGASAGVEAGVDSDLADLGVGVDVKAGIGAEYEVGAKASWQEVGLQVDGGLALGIGLGIGFDVSFSPEALLESFIDPIGATIGSLEMAYELAESSIVDPLLTIDGVLNGGSVPEGADVAAPGPTDSPVPGSTEVIEPTDDPRSLLTVVEATAPAGDLLVDVVGGADEDGDLGDPRVAHHLPERSLPPVDLLARGDVPGARAVEAPPSRPDIAADGPERMARPSIDAPPSDRSAVPAPDQAARPTAEPAPEPTIQPVPEGAPEPGPRAPSADRD